MRMNIVSSLNDQYTRYACVMLTSLLTTQDRDNEIHIYLLHRNLSGTNCQRLTDCVEKYGGHLHFLQVDDQLFKEFPTNSQWTSEAYFRLALVDILPEEIDRLLYLDVDTIVNKPLDDMYFTDFGDVEIWGQADASQPPFKDARDDIFHKWIQNDTLTYCCSGVTLWNLKKMRGRYNFRTYLNLARDLKFSMVAPDQDLLNYIHQDYIRAWEDTGKYGLYAKLAYNCDVHYDEVKSYTSIVHFAGQKPWLGQYVHYDIEKLWWDYAKLTPFYYEMMEEFVEAAINDPLIYNTMSQSLAEKEAIKAELEMSLELNKKLAAMLT